MFDGGAQRTNLEFVVVPTSSAAKFSDIHQILMADLQRDDPGGAIVYCSTRSQTEQVAEFLPRERDRCRPLSCRIGARDKEERTEELHQWKAAGDRRHQRLWHGHRQAGCAPRYPRRHPRVA